MEEAEDEKEEEEEGEEEKRGRRRGFRSMRSWGLRSRMWTTWRKSKMQRRYK